ncbi:MAG: hypothetical protein ACRD4O_07300, partial [Bryobacteraceae bacterium]
MNFFGGNDCFAAEFRRVIQSDQALRRSRRCSKRAALHISSVLVLAKGNFATPPKAGSLKIRAF